MPNRSNVYKRNTFWISGIRFTYKFVISDIKTKQNIFWIFLKYWPSSRDFNKLVIKAKMHAKAFFFWSFLCCMKIEYEFLALRDLAVCKKTKTCFFFLMFWQKQGILILDLYFYDVKIQTNIKQNLVEKYVEELQIFKNIFFENFFWTGLDPAHSC